VSMASSRAFIALHDDRVTEWHCTSCGQTEMSKYSTPQFGLSAGKRVPSSQSCVKCRRGMLVHGWKEMKQRWLSFMEEDNVSTR
jgi:hypothetical protein